MRLTNLRHACVRLEKDGAALVIDPGVFSRPDALAVADAVLITHEHVDHVDDEVLRTAMTGNPGLELWTNGSVASQYADFGGRVHTVAHGDVFQAAGFDVHVYGQKHAEIHRDIPIVENTGFLVDGEVFHPGDALTVPEDRIGNAPWLKVSEMIDYGRAVDPQRGYAIHDGLLNENGLGLMRNLMTLATGPSGGTFSRLEPGTSVDL